MSAIIVVVIIIIIVVIGLYWMGFKKANSGFTYIPTTVSYPNLDYPPPDILVHDKGFFLYPGQKWPDPKSAGCTPPRYPNTGGWITSRCSYGVDPRLIMGGMLSCLEISPSTGRLRKNGVGDACSQATKPHPSYGTA